MIYPRLGAHYDAAHYRFARTQSRAMASVPWERRSRFARWLTWLLK